MNKTYKPLTPNEKITIGVLAGALTLTSAIMVTDTIASQDSPETLSQAQIQQTAQQHDQKIQLTTQPDVVAESTDSLEPPASIRVEYTFEPMVIRASAKSIDKTAKPESVVASSSESNSKSPKKISAVALSTEEKDVNFIERSEEQLEKGNLRQAYTSLRQHLFVNTPTSEVLYQVALLGRELKDYKVAQEALLDAGVLDPDNSEIQVELARVQIAKKDYQSARMSIRRALRIDVDNAMAWNVAGRIAMMQYHWQRAENAFRQAIAIAPTHPMMYNNLGLLYVKMSEGEQAVDALEASVELFGDETPYFVYNNLGLAYEKIDAFEDARDAFELAIKTNPRYTRARINLDRTLIQLAEVEKKQVEAVKLAAEVSAKNAPEAEVEVGVGASQ
ncbi:MAG: tetratricopeptide repeat protein [Myxococcota bacterium]|nr:tetratricopeptide repeat protein [Myxococcota bacterium]